MNVLTGKSVAWIVLATILFLYAGDIHAKAPLRIAYPVFAPFHYHDDRGRLTGLFYDIITEAVEKRLDVPLIWTPYPWSRCQENLKAGRDDAIMTVPTPGRALYTETHGQPFYTKPLHLFSYVGHPKRDEMSLIQNIAAIGENEFSVITYSGNGWHKRNVAALGIKTYETGSLDNVWKMLVRGRGDIVIESPVSAWPDLRRLGFAEQVIDTGAVVAAMSFYLLIRAGSEHAGILARFDDVIESMRKDGTMGHIENRYQ